jgi:hypothetical protein
MEVIPSFDPASRTATEQFLKILWKQEVHCRVHKSPRLVRIQSKMEAVIPPHSILIRSSCLPLGLPSGLFPSGFPTKTLYVFLLSPVCVYQPQKIILH